MADWFRRDSKNIKTNSKRDTEEGLWHSCPKCRAVIYRKVLKETEYLEKALNNDFKDLNRLKK